MPVVSFPHGLDAYNPEFPLGNPGEISLRKAGLAGLSYYAHKFLFVQTVGLLDK